MSLQNINNKKLYESDEVVEKYSANNTRVRSLNIPEKTFIDRFGIKDQNVLVLGSGGGRVPVNLLVYGNKVRGLDRSKKLAEIASRNFPRSKFTDLSLEEGDATDLRNIPNESFDTVFFPMNTIDYIEEYAMREKALKEASSKVKSGGILAFSSHNKLAYFLSPKISFKDRSFQSLRGEYRYASESVIGGGVIFKGNPSFVVSETERITGMSFVGFICDARNKFEKVFAINLKTAQLFFPYILYVFRK